MQISISFYLSSMHVCCSQTLSHSQFCLVSAYHPTHHIRCSPYLKPSMSSTCFSFKHQKNVIFQSSLYQGMAELHECLQLTGNVQIRHDTGPLKAIILVLTLVQFQFKPVYFLGQSGFSCNLVLVCQQFSQTSYISVLSRADFVLKLALIQNNIS